MAIHARVEETAWSLSPAMLALIEGREPDDGVPQSVEWQALVERLASELPRKP